MVMPLLKDMLCLISAAFITLVMYFFVLGASAESSWVIFSILTLSTMVLQPCSRFEGNQTLITGALSAVLVFTQVALFSHFPLSAIFLGLVTLFSIYYGQFKPRKFLSMLLINFLVLFSTLHPVKHGGFHFLNSVISDSVMRAACIFSAATIIWLWQMLFGKILLEKPNKLINAKVSAGVVTVLKALRRLNDDIFACFLEPAYQDNTYLFEHRIHVQKNHLLVSLIALRKNLLPETNAVAHSCSVMVMQLDKLFDLMLDYAQLRRRVSDNAIFSVCFVELLGIRDEINKLLSDMVSTFPKGNFHLSTQGLLEKINRFEEVYQSVLQVSAREPLVFLLFIAGLKDFCQEYEALYSSLLAIRGQK